MKRLILSILFFIISTMAWANVPNATPLYNQYSCNSTTEQWPYAFQITAASDMQVYVNNNAGTITLEPSSTYSVDQSNLWVNYPLTGSACPTGSTITIQASTPQTQITTYSQRTPFTASAVGASFDKLTLIAQQLQAQLNRAILAPAGTSSFTFPSSIPGNILGWDPVGSGNIVNFVPNTGAYLSQASTADAQTATNNTKYMTPLLVATEVQYPGAVSIPAANVPGVATSGANSNITSLTGLSTALSTAQGGTGSTASANLMNGVVVLNSSDQLPASSGALLINIPLVNQTAPPYVKISNTQSSGTNGGTVTSGSWGTIVFNTKDSDTSSIATLNSNQITLPAGTYQVNASLSFAKCDHIITRLYNSTDSALLLSGSSEYNANGSSTSSGRSFINGTFTLSASKTLTFQYTVSTTESTDGQGLASMLGTEVYSIATFTKVA